MNKISKVAAAFAPIALLLLVLNAIGGIVSGIGLPSSVSGGPWALASLVCLYPTSWSASS